PRDTGVGRILTSVVVIIVKFHSLNRGGGNLMIAEIISRVRGGSIEINVPIVAAWIGLLPAGAGDLVESITRSPCHVEKCVMAVGAGHSVIVYPRAILVIVNLPPCNTGFERITNTVIIEVVEFRSINGTRRERPVPEIEAGDDLTDGIDRDVIVRRGRGCLLP